MSTGKGWLCVHVEREMLTKRRRHNHHIRGHMRYTIAVAVRSAASQDGGRGLALSTRGHLHRLIVFYA